MTAVYPSRPRHLIHPFTDKQTGIKLSGKEKLLCLLFLIAIPPTIFIPNPSRFYRVAYAIKVEKAIQGEGSDRKKPLKKDIIADAISSCESDSQDTISETQESKESD